jgi:hypothetical protein
MKSQTINLLKKELFLGNSLQTIIWTICCFGMFFIPSYPMYVGPFYLTLGIMMTFALNQSSHDILYTVLLPVRKIDVVKARFLYCGLLEFFGILCALIAYPIRSLAGYPANSAGINLTIAYFGLQLVIFAIFNLIFLGNVYKDPLKPGLRFLAAAVVYFLFYALFELPVWIYLGIQNKANGANGAITPNTITPEEVPVLAKIGSTITSTDGSAIITQLCVLLVGILLYVITWLITFRRAARQFEKYDL